MKELELGELIEPCCLVIMYVDGKEYKSYSIKTDGSYINVHFRHIEVTLPRVYTKQFKEPDEYGVCFRVYKHHLDKTF